MFKTWEELEESIKDCNKCKLCKTRQNIVFGTGNKQAKLMFIGEGPGADEDRLGEPFVGRAGKLMDLAFEILAWRDGASTAARACGQRDNVDRLYTHRLLWDERWACSPFSPSKRINAKRRDSSRLFACRILEKSPLKRFTFEKGEMRGGGTAPPGPK